MRRAENRRARSGSVPFGWLDVHPLGRQPQKLFSVPSGQFSSARRLIPWGRLRPKQILENTEQEHEHESPDECEGGRRHALGRLSSIRPQQNGRSQNSHTKRRTHEGQDQRKGGGRRKLFRLNGKRKQHQPPYSVHVTRRGEAYILRVGLPAGLGPSSGVATH